MAEDENLEDIADSLNNENESRVIEGTNTRVGESYESDDFYFPSEDDNVESEEEGVEIPNKTNVRIRYYNEENLSESPRRSGEIILTFPQPNVSVDSSTRTVKHDIIGDKTVVQKIGESATEVSIEGICTNQEALEIDTLSDYDFVNVDSHRWGSKHTANRSSVASNRQGNNGYAIITSTSTSPIADGGGVTAAGGEYHWTHEFTIELTSIDSPFNEEE